MTFPTPTSRENDLRTIDELIEADIGYDKVSITMWLQEHRPAWFARTRIVGYNRLAWFWSTFNKTMDLRDFVDNGDELVRCTTCCRYNDDCETPCEKPMIGQAQVDAHYARTRRSARLIGYMGPEGLTPLGRTKPKKDTCPDCDSTELYHDFIADEKGCNDCGLVFE